MGAAVACVREIFPKSSIRTVRLESPQVRVRITTDAFGDKPHTVWSGKQSNLLERFPKRRRKAVRIIKDSLITLREELL